MNLIGIAFSQADNPTSRPIYDTINKRTQFLFAALELNSSDSSLDLIKTEARKNLNDFAFYANMSLWSSAFNGGAFYVFNKGTTENSVALPAETQGITSPTVQQVNAVSLARELA